MRDKHPVWSNFKHKTYHQNGKKKKRNKYSRRCLCAILMIVLLLAIVAILLALLIKPSSATTRNIIAVLRWNQSGITVAGIVAKSGNTSNLFNRPHGFAIDSTGNVYIADSWNHRIQFWENGTSQGSTIAGFGGILNITLNLPYGLTRDPKSGILYIADTINHRVIRYRLGDLVGIVVVGGNGSGSNNTQLSTPGGLYFDSPSNSLLIANSAAHNIVRWVIGADSWILVAGNLNGTLGNTSMELNSAFDVEVDSMGNVYAADRSNHRIQFFLLGQSTGVTIAGVTGATGINSTRLNTPSSMTLDNQLNLYVADTNNHRIQKFLRY